MTRTFPEAPWQASTAAHIYLAHIRVRHHELDPLGHVNNAAYLNYLEQAAIDHAAAAGYDEERLREIGGTFVARRHEIDYLRPARTGDWLRVTTWPVELGAARALRLYQINRLTPDESTTDGLYAPNHVPMPAGDLLVRARTEWAWINVKTGRPRRLPQEVVRAFLKSE